MTADIPAVLPPAGAEDGSMHILRDAHGREIMARWLGGTNFEWAFTDHKGWITILRADRVYRLDWRYHSPVPDPDAVARLVEAAREVVRVTSHCPRIERGVGGMTIEAQLRRTEINRVPAWPIEELDAALAPFPKPAEEPTP